MVAEAGVTDSVGEVLAVMVLADPAQVSAGAALVRDSAGHVDLRVEVFLVGEIAVASVIAVSVGESAAFAIVGFAISEGTLSILDSMALDIRVITNTTTRITTHTRITTIGVDSAGGNYRSPRSGEMASVVGVRIRRAWLLPGGLSDSMIGPESATRSATCKLITD